MKCHSAIKATVQYQEACGICGRRPMLPEANPSYPAAIGCHKAKASVDAASPQFMELNRRQWLYRQAFRLETRETADQSRSCSPWAIADRN
jgi:hypothetical protein